MKRLLMIVGPLIAVLVVLAWLSVRSFHFESASLLPIGHMVAAPMAQAVVIQRSDPVQSELLKGSSVAEAYEKNSKPFEKNFALVHTYLNAVLVAREASRGGSLPLSSENLASQLKETALDHWGRPFCVTGNAETILVISSGENQKLISCGGTVNARDLKGIPRGRLIKTDSGYLTLVMDRKTLIEKLADREDPQPR